MTYSNSHIFFFVELFVASLAIYGIGFYVMVNFYRKDRQYSIHRTPMRVSRLYPNLTYPLLHYSTNWLEEINKNVLISHMLHFPYHQYPLCRFQTISTVSDSSTRDLIITSMISDITGIVPFLRSLRTTRSQASVVVLVDQDADRLLSNDIKSFIRESRAFLFNVGQLNAKKSEFLPFMLYYDFLCEIETVYDRILLIDCHSTIFREDPFTSMIPRRQMTFVRHPKNMRDVWSSVDQLKMLIKDKAYWFTYRPLIITSMFFGDYDGIIIFLDTLISQINFEHIEQNSVPLDAYFHNVLHNRIFSNKGYVLEFTSEGNGYVHTALTNVHESILCNERTSYSGNNNMPLYIIQGYDKTQEMLVKYYNICPKLQFDIPNYMRSLSPQKIGELSQR